MSIRFFFACALSLSALCATAQNVGIGTENPSRAKLEVHGVAGNGSTNALFGGTSTGISLQQNWPTIGFNQYRDNTAGNGRYIGNGAAAIQYFDPTNATMYMDWFNPIFPGNAGSLTNSGTRLMTLAPSNVSLGLGAFNDNTTGQFNVAIGESALRGNISGSSNVAIGQQAMWVNQSGQNNTALGCLTLDRNTSGYDNVAIGFRAAYNNVGGFQNTAVGTEALYNSNGYDNVAIGYKAVYNNIVGIGNTAIGNFALQGNMTGGYNTAVGFEANVDLSNRAYNTIIGATAHIQAEHSTVVGYGSYTNTNNLALLGNPYTLYTGGYTNWSNFSDGRFKTHVEEKVKGLEFILRLRPVTYHMDVRGLYNLWGISPYGKEEMKMSDEQKRFTDETIAQKEAITMTGFVAQEVEKAAGETGYDFSGVMKPTHDKDHYRLAYAEFVVPLVKAVQEQQQQLEELKKERETMRAENTELRARLDRVEKLLSKPAQR